MSNADELRISYVEESSYGVNPGGTLIDLRITSESLKQLTASVKSAELRSDRQITDLIRININVIGDLGFELSYASWDDWLAAVLFSSAWSSEVDLSCANTTIVKATGTLTDAGAAASFTGALVGQWIKISGATLPANNGYFKILTVTDTDNIIIAGAAALADDTTEDLTIAMLAQIVNGVTQSSFAVEKEFTDLTNKFELNLGLVPDTLALSLAQDQIITGAFGCLGKIQASAAATGGSGYTEVNTNPVINGIDDVLSILEGVPVIDNDNTLQTIAAELSLANNIRQRGILGQLGPISLGAGKCVVEGSLQAYYADEALMDKYLDWTSSALAFVLEDDDGNAYIVEMPRVKFTDGARVAGGENTDIIADMTWEAKMHETEDVTIRICKDAA